MTIFLFFIAYPNEMSGLLVTYINNINGASAPTARIAVIN